MELRTKDGNIIFSTDNGTRKFVLMGDDYITLKINTGSPFYPSVGSYCECDFGRFELTKESNAVPTIGTGYNYSVQLDNQYIKWNNKLFMWHRGQIDETSNFSVAVNLVGAMDLILADLKALGFQYRFKGVKKDYSYNIYSANRTLEDGYIIEGIDEANEVKTLQFDGMYLLDALYYVAKQWNTECWIEDSIINIGKCENTSKVEMSYSEDGNIAKISRSDSSNTHATRLYVYGGTTNVPARYRKTLIFTTQDGTTIPNLSFGTSLFPDSLKSSKPDGIKTLTLDKAPAYTINSGTGTKLSIIHSWDVPVSGTAKSGTYRVDLSRLSLTYTTSPDNIELSDVGVKIYLVYNANGDSVLLSSKFGNQLDGNYIFDKDIDLSTAAVKIEYSATNNKQANISFTFNIGGYVNVYLNGEQVRTKINIITAPGKPELSGTKMDCVFNPDHAIPGTDGERKMSVTLPVGTTFTIDGIIEDKCPTDWFYSQESGNINRENRLQLDEPLVSGDGDEETYIDAQIIHEDIYPRMKGHYLTSVEKGSATAKDEDDKEYKYTTYKVRDDKLIDFKESYIIQGEKLEMNFSGELHDDHVPLLAGLTIPVIFNEASDTFEMIRTKIGDTYFPNENFYPQVGDNYTLTGYDASYMAGELTKEAEAELKERGLKDLADYKVDNSTYNVTLFSYKGNFYQAGTRVDLKAKGYFKDIDGNIRKSRVIGYELDLAVPYKAPVYTVGEAEVYSRLQAIENKIDSVNKGSFVGNGSDGSSVYVIGRGDSTAPSDTNVYSAARSNEQFLRKDQEDRTAYMISLTGGVNIGNRARFGEYITGVSGGYIDEKGDAELKSLYLRSRLFVPVIAYNKIQYFKGQNVISPGGGMDVKSFVDNKDGSYTITPDITDADGISFEVDDILTTSFIFRNSERKFAGFELRKFRVTAVDTEKKTFTIIPKPNTNWEPAELMQLCQTGNFTNTERQTYMILDTINGNNCITFYDNANTWDPEPAQVKSWLGQKKGMEIQGINLDNYSGVFQNVFVSGLFYQFDSITGGMVRVPIDKGAWKAGKYAYYDRVTHNGSLWLCINEKGTSAEPSDNSADWLKQVAQGLPGNDGLSVIGGGHWQSANTPYKKNTLVEFANCVFMSKVDTSQPPMPLITTQTGSYLTTQDGGYLILSWTVNSDWEMYLDARPLQGQSITFLGEFASAPANPNEGDSYRNTTDRCTYIYRNGTWMVMTQDGTDGKDGKDYEWIYTRTNTMMPLDKPKSEQTDDYVPTGWTDDMAGVDEEHQLEWACKRTKVNGTWSDWSTPAITSRWSKDGESVIIADLDNEMAGIPLTYEGKTNKAYTLTTNVWMSYGLTKLALTNLTASGPAGWTMTADKATGKVTVAIPSNVAVADTNNIVITLTVQNSGQNYSRTLTFTILGTKAGAPGEDATVYSLVISASNIKRDKKGVYIPTSITASKQKTQGNAITPDTPDGELKYIIDGGTETAYTTAIDAAKVTKNIKFNLYIGGKLADTETVPLIIDGSDGAAGKGVKSIDIWYYLSTSATSQAGGSWSTTPPAWEKGKWYWQKTITTYSDNTTSESSPSVIPNGGDGVGVKAITEQYYLSTSPTAQTGGEWTDTRPGGNSGKYIWTRSVITYTNGTVTYTAGVCITGNDGASVSNLGHWHTGLHVPYLGIVRMGKSSYMCNVQGGTDKPPVFTLTTQTGSRLTTQDGGYLLTGLINTDEYEIVATDGEDGESIKGDPGTPGEDAVTADLTNEMMTVPLSSEGKTTAAWSDTSQAMMYVGASRATITKIETMGLSAFSVTGSGDTFTVAAKANTAIPDSTRGTVNITGTYNGKTYTRYCGISIAGVKAGKAGEDAIYYKLLVSPSSVLKDAGGNVSTDRVSCTRYKCQGGKMTETTDGTFTVYKDNGSGSDISGSSMSIGLNTFTKSVRFVLIVNGSTADEETVFIVEDGSVVDFVGHWQSANVPYKKNKAVRFGGATYVALRDTSNPPMPLLTTQTGSYIVTQNGGYLIAALSLNSDWRLMAQDGQNGKDGTDGVNGDDAVAYSLECPISVINYNSVGTPTPSAFVVTLKKTVGKNVSNASDLYLVSRGYNYNGVWADGSNPTKTGTINVQARVGYTQFAVRAYVSQSDAQAWNNNYVCEKGIGVSQDGATGATLIDRGLFTQGQKYYWNATERDKVVWAFQGVYYNFLVKNYGATVTAAPSSPTGDSNWEAMNYMRNIITDALFADQANIAGFTFGCSLDLTTEKYTKAIMASQNKRSDGTSNTIINGITGEINTNKLIAIDANITGIIKATSGRIAGFKINGTSLTNVNDDGSFTNDATVLFRNDKTHTFAAIGGNTLPASTGATAVARFENNDTTGSWVYGGTNYAVIVSAQGAESNIAIAMNGGCISGMAYRVQIVGNSSSTVTISKSIGVVFLINTSHIDIKLPDMDSFDDGHMIKFKRLNGSDQDYSVTLVTGNGSFPDGTTKKNCFVFDSGNTGTSITIVSIGDAMEFVYGRDLNLSSYRGAWVQFKNPRDW